MTEKKIERFIKFRPISTANESSMTDSRPFRSEIFLYKQIFDSKNLNEKV